MNQLAPNPQTELRLKVLNGPDKGVVYKITGSTVRIGRGEDNDVALSKDKKCSRYHALLSLNANGLYIENISDKNTLHVDGVESSAATIKPNSIIQLGNTRLQLILKTSKPSLHLAGNPEKKKPKPMFWILVAAIGVVFWFLLTSKAPSPNTDSLANPDSNTLIEENRKVVQEVIQDRASGGLNSDQYREAQAAYIKGSRDFQKGQYERAGEHFQTCLALFPNHRLCAQSLNESRTKFSELIQYYLTLGYDQQRKNQFKQCKNSFLNVKIMQKDKTSTIYKEAEAGYLACDARQRERF